MTPTDTAASRRAAVFARQAPLINRIAFPQDTDVQPLVPTTVVDGQLAFEQPDRGVFATAGRRLQRNKLRTGDSRLAGLIRPLSQTLAGKTLEDFESPVVRTDRGFVRFPDGTVSDKRANYLSGADFWKSIPEVYRLFSAEQGRDEEFYTQFDNFLDAEAAFGFHMQMQELDESIAAQGGFTRAASVGVGLAADILTDPVTYATLGTGVGLSIGGRALARKAGDQAFRATMRNIIGAKGARQLTRVAANAARNEAMFVLPSERLAVALGVRGLAAAEGAVLGGAVDIGLQAAEHDVLEDYYAATDDFQIDYMRTGLSSVFAAGATATLMTIFAGGVRSNRFVEHIKGAGGFTGIPGLSRKAGEGIAFRRPEDGYDFDVNAASVTDAHTKMTEVLYGERAQSLPWRHHEDWFDVVAALGIKGKTEEDLVEFLKKFPTYDELMAWIPKAEITDQMRWSSLRAREHALEKKVEVLGEQNIARLERLKRLEAGKVRPEASELPADLPYKTSQGATRYGFNKTGGKGAVIMVDGRKRAVIRSGGKTLDADTGKPIELSRVREIRDGFDRTIWVKADFDTKTDIVSTAKTQLTDAEAKELNAIKREIYQLERKMEKPRAAVTTTKYSRAQARIAERVARLTELRSQPSRTSVDEEEIQRLTTALTRDRAALVKLVREHVGGRGQRPAARQIEAGPRNPGDRLPVDQQAKQLGELYRGDENLPSHSFIRPGLLAQLAQKSGPVGRLLSAIALQGTGRTQVKSMNDPLLNLMAQVVHEFDHTVASLNRNTPHALSLTAQHVKNLRKLHTRGLRTWNRFMRSTNNLEERRAFARQVTLELSGVDTDNAIARQAAGEIRVWMDGMGKRGVDNGTLTEVLEGYLPYRLMEDKLVDSGALITKARELAAFWRDRLTYGENLHRGTLRRLGIIADDPKTGKPIIDPSREGKYAAVPTKYDDLTPEDAKLYEADLYSDTGRLVEEAVRAINRKMKRDLVDPDARTLDADRFVFRDEANAQRKLDQEFWLTEDNINSGLVDHDWGRVLLEYINGTGYRIGRQDTVNELTGSTNYTWEGLLQFMRNRSSQFEDPHDRELYMAMVDMLSRKERQVGGRLPPSDGLEASETQYLGAVIGQSMRTAINTTTGTAAFLTEVPQSLMDAVVGQDNVIRMMKELLRLAINPNLRREFLEDIGYGLEVLRHQSRYAFQLDGGAGKLSYTLLDRLRRPIAHVKDVAAGRERARSSNYGGRKRQTALAVLESASDLAAVINPLPEEFSTNLGRTIAGYSNLNRVNRYVQNGGLLRLAEELDKLGPNPTSRQFDGAARAAGMRPWVARRFVRSGLVNDDVRIAVQMFRAIDPQSLRTPEGIARAINDVSFLNPEHGQIMTEFADRVYNLVDTEIAHVVTKADVWDKTTSDGDRGAIATLQYMFFNFPRAFYGNRFNDVTNRGPIESMFLLSMFMLTETLYSNVRAVTLGGESPETLLAKWEEDPDAMLLNAVSRIPWMGPWTYVGTYMAAQAVGLDTPRYSMNSGGAGITMVDELRRATFSTLKSTLEGEPEITPGAARAFGRLIPGWNYFPVRLAERLLEGFGADEDRQ